MIPVLVQLNEAATQYLLLLAKCEKQVESIRQTYSLVPSIRIGNVLERVEFGDLLEPESELVRFVDFPPLKEWLRFSDYSEGILIELNPGNTKRMGNPTEAENRILKPKHNVREESRESGKLMGNYSFTATVEKTYDEDSKADKPPVFDAEALLLKLGYAQDEADRTGEPVNVSDDYGYVGTCFPKRSE